MRIGKAFIVKVGSRVLARVRDVPVGESYLKAPVAGAPKNCGMKIQNAYEKQLRYAPRLIRDVESTLWKQVQLSMGVLVGILRTERSVVLRHDCMLAQTDFWSSGAPTMLSIQSYRTVSIIVRHTRYECVK